jgi:hypothetical protein
MLPIIVHLQSDSPFDGEVVFYRTKIHYQLSLEEEMSVDFGNPWTSASCHMQGAEDRRMRRISNTPQGGVIEGNTADVILMVDQGEGLSFTTLANYSKLNIKVQ